MSEPATRRKGLPQQVKMRHNHHFVDELTARHETPVGKFVPLAEIEPDPAQPRSAMGNLDDLVASIRDKGVLEPSAGPARIPAGKGEQEPPRSSPASAATTPRWRLGSSRCPSSSSTSPTRRRSRSP